MGYHVGETCKKCQKPFEGMDYPLGVPQSEHHRSICLWCDLHYSDSFFVKCQIPVYLEEYFYLGFFQLGSEVPRIRVISAKGTPGTVEKVTWVEDRRFVSESFKEKLVDEEKSIVQIKWDNGNYSDQPITELSEVIVQPYDENICAALRAKIEENHE